MDEGNCSRFRNFCERINDKTYRYSGQTYKEIPVICGSRFQSTAPTIGGDWVSY
jgi:hypothetical protein